jgi:diguanylate cyclase (GGDEF)-like protein
VPPGIKTAGAPDAVLVTAIQAVTKAALEATSATTLLGDLAAALRGEVGCRSCAWLKSADDGSGWETVAATGAPQLIRRSLPGNVPTPDEIELDTVYTCPDGTLAIGVRDPDGSRPLLLTATASRDGWTSSPEDVLRVVAATSALALDAISARAALLTGAHLDQLTGLGNRRGFTERVALERERTTRYRHPLTVLLLDLDGFKRVNERLGHAGGDSLLVECGECIKNEVRAIDYVARLSGDEFGVVMPQSPTQAAMALAERLRVALRELPVAQAHSVTASIGIAGHAGEETSESLMHRADIAMYAAKGAGRNRYSVHPNDERDLVVMESPELDEVDILTVRALVMAVDAKDAYTHHHSRAVGEVSRAIAEELGLPARTVRYLHLAGVLHDVGKIGISTEILTKPTPLTDIEWLELKAHVHIGERMLRGIGLPTAAKWVRHHHESVDGSGYPDGLAGDDIPLPSRVLLVADAFDAMVSNRVYRAGRPPEAAMQEIESLAGKQFDLECAQALRRALTAQPDLWSLHERRPFLI